MEIIWGKPSICMFFQKNTATAAIELQYGGGGTSFLFRVKV